MKKTIVVGGLTLALVAGSAFAVMAAGDGGYVHPCGQASEQACTCAVQSSISGKGAVTIKRNPSASAWDSTERRLGIE